MRRKIQVMVLLLPSILLCILFLFYDIIVSSVWSDFFQSNPETAFRGQFIVVFVFGLLITGVIAGFVISARQTFFYFIKKEKDSSRVSLITLLFILMPPLIGLLISKTLLPNDSILKSLKSSFMKEQIDVVRMSQWLTGLNDEIELPCRLMDLEKFRVPTDIQEMLEPYFEKVSLRSDINGKPILEMNFFTLYFDVGIVVGSCPDESFPSTSPMQSIDLNDNAFIWVNY